ncbi:tripartite tricarboxylate transporter TctB family protein [Paracidovorax citrulli]
MTANVQRKVGTAGRFDRPRIVVGALLLLLALVVFADAGQLRPGPAAGIGPSAGMLFVAGLLAVLGAVHLITAARRPGAMAPSEPAATPLMRWKPVSLVLGGLLALMFVLKLQFGFIAGATLLFIATSLAFGERRLLLSAVIGVALNLLVYAFFAKALSLALPAGPLERLVFG